MAVDLTVNITPSTGTHLPPRVPGATGWDSGGPARPVAWLGAEAAGGLALPAAMPTAHQMYAPRGVWLDDDRLIVADTGNHRVLIWHDLEGDVPNSHSDADVVLGQPDTSTEGAQAGGRGPENGMRLPTGLLVHDGALVVADAWNHRLLVWNDVPRASDTAPDHIIGQAGPAEVDENRGGPCGPLTFYWPFGIAMVDGMFWVADTGNRRVLGWPGIPQPNQAPAVVLGQTTATERDENRGRIGPDSFRWPHDMAGLARPGEPTRLLIADAGNHRVLGWTGQPTADQPADFLLGQTDFETGSEFPYGPQSADGMRFPYAIDAIRVRSAAGPGSILALADTANNRVLIWDDVPTSSNVPADRVLGQSDFAGNGENRWDLVGDDTFCWPYGLCLHQRSTTDASPGESGSVRLAVSDSGNNRVMIWTLDA